MGQKLYLYSKLTLLMHFSLFQQTYLCLQMLIVLFSKFNPIEGANYFYVLFALLNLQNDFIRPLKIVQYKN